MHGTLFGCKDVKHYLSNETMVKNSNLFILGTSFFGLRTNMENGDPGKGLKELLDCCCTSAVIFYVAVCHIVSSPNK